MVATSSVQQRQSTLALDGLLSPTIEAVVLNAISCVLAQAFTIYTTRSFESIDTQQILQSMLFTAMVAGPNYMFQVYLEKKFPTRKPVGSQEKPVQTESKTEKDERYGQLSIRNTVVKFLLDQSLSATTNTMLFICLFGMIKGHSIAYIQQDLAENFWSLLFAGYRFWPMVCLVNLVMVPMEYRSLVGNAAGLGWGIFLNFW